MAFLVEDGTGIEFANATATVEFVDDYHSDRGNTTWTGTTGEKQAAIIRATDFLERRWGPYLKGQREFPEIEGLSFPRIDMYDRNGYAITGVPTKWQQACAEYALREIAGTDLLPDISTDTITSETKKVGPIEVSTSYSVGGVEEIPEYPEADLLVYDFVFPQTGRSYR